MDRLWFHQIVLFSESTASVGSKPIKTSLPISECVPCPFMLPPLDEVETSTNEPLSPESEASSESTYLTSQDDSNKEGHWKRHKLLNLWVNRVGLHSSSSSTLNHHMKFWKLATAMRPQKSMNYRTQGELELEEVKGFIDLGFIFKKENVCARMMNVVPGLQGLSMHQNNEDEKLIDASKSVEGEGDVTLASKDHICRRHG